MFGLLTNNLQCENWFWCYYSLCRIDYPTLVATVEELLKDHQDLLLRFNAFFAVEPKKTIPPEANKELGQSQAMVGRSEPPKPAFDEPAKYREFIKILNDARRGYELSFFMLYLIFSCELILMLLVSLQR